MTKFDLDWCSDELTETLLFALFDGGAVQGNRIGENWMISVRLKLDDGADREEGPTNEFRLSLGFGELIPEPSEIHGDFFVHDTMSEAKSLNGDIAVSVVGDAGNGKGELRLAGLLLWIVRTVIGDICDRLRMVAGFGTRDFLFGEETNSSSIRICKRYQMKKRAMLADKQILAKISG